MNKHRICCRRCGGGVGTQRQNKENGLILLKGAERDSFFAGTNPSLIMMMTLLVVSMCVLGDDTQAFRKTLSSLCSLNKEGQFGSCCVSYDISSVTLASSAARDCFISSLSFTSGSITYLFVIKLHFSIAHFSEVLKRKD